MANTNHPYLPKSEQLYSKPPLDKVQMQYLWKVMDDLNNGLISVNEAVEILNSNPAGIAGVAKGDLIVFDGISWGILTVGADGEALVGDSAAAQGLSYQVVTTAPAGLDTQIQFNNAGAFGADGSFTTTPAKITISKDRSGTDGALHIIKGDAAKQYIIMEEDAAAPDEVYMGFKAQNGDVVAMGMKASAGAPIEIIFTDPSAAVLAWLDVVTGDLGVTNLSGVGTRLVTADATGILATTAMVTQYTDEMAQDAVGGILNTTDFTYDDATPEITINNVFSYLIGSTGNVDTTATPAEEILYSVLIPGGTLAVGDSIVCTSFHKKSSGAGTQTARVRLHTLNAVGGTTYYGTTFGGTNGFNAQFRIVITGASAQAGSFGLFGVSGTDYVTSALAIANDMYVLMTSQKSVAGDGAHLRMGTVEILKRR